jgi:hypothetical protein
MHEKANLLESLLNSEISILLSIISDPISTYIQVCKKENRGFIY